MQWMKVSAQLWRHPKWSSVSPQAKALWVTAASWCCENDTFGDVSFQFLSNFSQISRPNKYALELVEAGLWEVADNGYRFHDWDDHNVSKTAWEQGKAATRERVKKHREKKSNTARNTVSNAVTPSVSNAESNDAGNTVPFNIEVRSKKDISKDISLSPLPPLTGEERLEGLHT